MAALKIIGGRLMLRLNPVEKLMDLRLRSPTVPLAAVRNVTVVDRPGRILLDEVDLGFAGNTAPLGAVVTASSRAEAAGGRAAVFVYLRRTSVRVDLAGAASPWRLFLVSCRDPEEVAAAVLAASAQPTP
jgi:hypothetical protein